MSRAVFLYFLLLFGPSFGYKNRNWWDSAVVYNVYPRSFMDSNNDGTGDIRGIIRKLPYIKTLGADAVYLNPIFKSPMVDTGYDISDFKAIDPLFGSMRDFEDLIAECKKLDLKFVVDFVPNHTSDEHEWFKKSVRRIQPYTDYYVWKNPSGFANNGTALPPNKWKCMFGGSNWEWNEERQQFYYHAFYKNQPDLNYYNENVVEEMRNILRFWMGKKIDGIRIDAMQFLIENYTCSDTDITLDDDTPNGLYPCRVDIPKSVEYVKVWREVLDEYSMATDNERKLIMIEYFDRGKDNLFQLRTKYFDFGADVVFNWFLDFQKIQLNASYLTEKITKYTTLWTQKDYTMNWMLGVHDLSRFTTMLGEEMADALAMAMLLLPGNVFIYNGHELGMKDYEHIQLKGGWNWWRDAFRTPFQWNDSPQAGFSRKKKTWLPVNPDYYRVNVEEEMRDPKSHLNYYKNLIQLRKLPVFKTGVLQVHPMSSEIFAFSRFLNNSPDQKFITIINTGAELECVYLRTTIDSLPNIIYVLAVTINSEHTMGEILETTRCLPMRPKSAVLLSTDKSLTTGTTTNIFSSIGSFVTSLTNRIANFIQQ